MMTLFNQKNLFSIMAALPLLLSGCASAAPEQTAKCAAEREWTPAEIVVEWSDADPWEGFNRSMFEVTRVGTLYVLRPIGWLWGGILPRPAIRCINNAAENLSFPGRTFSCLLQNRWQDGGVESLRFLTNITLGVGGLFDPADDWFELYPRGETFGQVFECWGIGSGRTLVLPMCTATNVRDHVGSIFDMAFDIKTYLPYGASTGAGVNRAVYEFRPVYRMLKANADPYEIFKEYSTVNRRLDQEDWRLQRRLAAAAAPAAPVGPLASIAVPRPEGIHGRIVELADYRPEHPLPDTVRVIRFQPQTDETSWWTHLSPWNSDFTSYAKIPELPAIRENAPAMEYYYWPARARTGERKAPLAFVLPGIGSHHTSQTAVAMAEVLYQQGFAVVILPSAFCWSFYESRHPAPLPGYTPDDAGAVRETMKKVLAQLAEDYDFTPDGVSVVGYSMGGLHALFIAAAEEREDTLRIDRVVAINPPVDLIYALRAVDRCAATARGWPFEKVGKVFADGFGKVTADMKKVSPFFDPPPAKAASVHAGAAACAETAEVKPAPPAFDYRSHLSTDQAQLLAALSFRYALRDVLMVAARDRRVEFAPEYAYKWSSRTGFYLKADEIGFEDYLERFILPEYRKRLGEEIACEELGRRAGLRAIETTLRDNPKITVLHTLDDFLVSDADRRYLDAALGDRIVWFDHGSHLGNLYYVRLHRELLDRLIVPPPAAP